jgi:hypothetical protein
VRKLFSGEPEGRKLNVPAVKVKVTVAKPAVPSSSSSKQHKKTVRIVLLFTTFDLQNCFDSITGLLAIIMAQQIFPPFFLMMCIK